MPQPPRSVTTSRRVGRAGPYYTSRCYQEGRSKAILSRLEGSDAALSSERSYTLRVLPAGVIRGVIQAVRGDFGGAQRAAAIIVGLYVTAFGYVSARVEDRRGPTTERPTRASGGKSV
jgi:hypothetical protein